MVRNPEPGRQLLIASTGGHLAQLVKWASKIGADADSLWVTFQSPQSDSLLRDKRVMHVPYVAPRDFRKTGHAFAKLMRELDWRKEHFTAAISTGAALGLAGLGAARLHGVPCFYYESVSRAKGPSLTGRLLRMDPGVVKFCQYEHWAGGAWKYGGSLFDNYVAVPKTPIPQPRLFVTLGTIRPYRFDALVDAVLASGLADGRTTWQLGVTDRTGLPGTVVSEMSREMFEQTAREADVVITHSGVGTLMELLDLGIYPVVVPRRAAHSEHVDDHQQQVAEVLRARSIAQVCQVHDVDRPAIVETSGYTISRTA